MPLRVIRYQMLLPPAQTFQPDKTFLRRPEHRLGRDRHQVGPRLVNRIALKLAFCSNVVWRNSMWVWSNFALPILGRLRAAKAPAPTKRSSWNWPTAIPRRSARRLLRFYTENP